MSTINGLPVYGYRPQPAEAVDAVNAMKRLEELILRELDSLAARGKVDPRWLAMGRSHIEQGFMAVNRAIFQPARAPLEEDEA